MDNYFYYLRELIDNNQICQIDKRDSNREQMQAFLDKFNKEIEVKYPRNIYKTLRYIVVDQVHYLYNDAYEPAEIKDNASFTIAFQNDTYYFLLEKEMFNENVLAFKSEVDLINSKDLEGVKELYLEALNDFEMNMDFTFIDLKKRTKNDINYKFVQIDNQYSLLRLISFFSVK